MNSDIILLDEPTANLDYTAIKKLTELLLLLKKEGFVNKIEIEEMFRDRKKEDLKRIKLK